MLSNDVIEQISVTEITKKLACTKILVPKINEKDKIPSWDGEVYIYQSADHKNSNMSGVVNVQVKGTNQANLSKQTINYRVRVDDLKNYLLKNGVIYFVVYISNNFETQIYYNALTPVEIIKALKDCKEGKKTTTLEFRSLPDKNNVIVSIFTNFFANSKAQASFDSHQMMTIEKVIGNENISHITTNFTICASTTEEAKTAILEYPPSFYAVLKSNVSVPLILDTSPYHIDEPINTVIQCNGKIYYRNIIKRTYRECEEFILSNSLKYCLEKDNISFKFEWEFKGKFAQQVSDLEFIYNLYLTKKMIINGKEFGFEIANNDFSLERMRKDVELFKNVIEVFDKLHITKDLIISKLTGDDREKLKILVDAFKENKLIYDISAQSSPTVKLYISNVVILLGVEKIKELDNAYKIYDPFTYSNLRLSLIAENEKKYPVTIYSLLRPEDYNEIDNIPYTNIVAHHENFFNESTKEPMVAHNVVLSLLDAYDKSGNKNQLKSAQELCDWIISKTDDKEPINILNKLQIIKRERLLNSDEIMQLAMITENSQNDANKAGAYLLLENYKMVDYYLNLMDEKERQKFKVYPIYKRFMNKGD